MFARVITAQTETEGFDELTRLAQEQLPGAREQPGMGDLRTERSGQPRHRDRYARQGHLNRIKLPGRTVPGTRGSAPPLRCIPH